MNERFSAFLDNEATRDEADSVISALLRDETLRESWSRQHWLRTMLRAHSGEAVAAPDPEFSARVMRAIAADGQHETGAAVPPAASARAFGKRPRRHWRSMAGLAAVASATGFVLLVSNPLQRDGGTGTPPAASPTASIALADAGATGAPRVEDGQIVASNDLGGAAARAAQDQAPADHWAVSDPALEDELNSYLVEHNGLSRGYGLSATTPASVRVATYGQEPTQ